jgi:ornithine--oxo-acid transaminase
MLWKADDKDVAGFLVEPVQGEAGVLVPDDGYFKSKIFVKNPNTLLLMKFKLV